MIGAQQRWVEKVQERLRVTSAVLGDMKAIKMLGLERFVSSRVQQLRTDEIQTSKSFREYLITMILLCEFRGRMFLKFAWHLPSNPAAKHLADQSNIALTPINLAPVVTFGVYAIIAVYWKNETLLAAQAFTSVALISLLTTPVIVFIQSLPGVVQTIGNFDRIQKYCSDDIAARASDERDRKQRVGPVSERGYQLQSYPVQEDLTVRGSGFAWVKSGVPVLRDVDVRIPHGTITAVVGPVGSGKSSFLNTLLREMIPVSAQDKSRVVKPMAGPLEQEDDRQPMAYCAQQAWLESGTIRQNIVGMSPWDPDWYQRVLLACCLVEDLGQLQLGDHTQVGSGGVNLSGGQKQRIVSSQYLHPHMGQSNALQGSGSRHIFSAEDFAS
jgi:ATP-binding cassette, subfamily C (CFTR/MRP), member 1